MCSATHDVVLTTHPLRTECSTRHHTWCLPKPESAATLPFWHAATLATTTHTRLHASPTPHQLWRGTPPAQATWACQLPTHTTTHPPTRVAPACTILHVTDASGPEAQEATQGHTTWASPGTIDTSTAAGQPVSVPTRHLTTCMRCEGYAASTVQPTKPPTSHKNTGVESAHERPVAACMPYRQ